MLGGNHCNTDWGLNKQGGFAIVTEENLQVATEHFSRIFHVLLVRPAEEKSNAQIDIALARDDDVFDYMVAQLDWSPLKGENIGGHCNSKECEKLGARWCEDFRSFSELGSQGAKGLG